jgi:SPP1 family predicted phage head-tail adaptor
MIDTAMLAAMREAIEQLLPDTCNILTATETADGQGGISASWGTTYGTVSCRLDMNTGREQVIGGGLQPFTKYMLSLPYNTTITTADRVEVNSTTYTVTSVNLNQSWMAVKRVELEKL